jgi:hypothetical protein
VAAGLLDMGNSSRFRLRICFEKSGLAILTKRTKKVKKGLYKF